MKIPESPGSRDSAGLSDSEEVSGRAARKRRVILSVPLRSSREQTRGGIRLAAASSVQMPCSLRSGVGLHVRLSHAAAVQSNRFGRRKPDAFACLTTGLAPLPADAGRTVRAGTDWVAAVATVCSLTVDGVDAAMCIL